jgi:hypothetical protein
MMGCHHRTNVDEAIHSIPSIVHPTNERLPPFPTCYLGGLEAYLYHEKSVGVSQCRIHGSYLPPRKCILRSMVYLPYPHRLQFGVALLSRWALSPGKIVPECYHVFISQLCLLPCAPNSASFAVPLVIPGIFPAALLLLVVLRVSYEVKFLVETSTSIILLEISVEDVKN